MKQVKLNNMSLDYIPKLPLYSQKILFFIIKKIFDGKLYNNEKIIIKTSKEELFGIFIRKTNQRSFFYKNVKPLFEPLHITLEYEYIFTSIISSISEKRKIEDIEIVINERIANIIAFSKNYFLLDYLQISKLKHRSSIIIYQLLARNRNYKKLKLYPGELNALLKTNYSLRDLKRLIFKARDEYCEKLVDIDFTFEILKEKAKKYFEFQIIEKVEMIQDNAKYNEELVNELYDHVLQKETSIFFITNKINGFNDFQIEYLYNKLRINGRAKIIDKIEANTTKTQKNIYFYKVICQCLLILTDSCISKTINEAISDIQKGKIKDNIAFILSKLKIEIQKLGTGKI